MPRGNPSPKLAITIDPDIHQSILTGRRPRGIERLCLDDRCRSPSIAATRRFGCGRAVGKEHGRFTAEEMNEARRRVRAQVQNSRTVRRSA